MKVKIIENNMKHYTGKLEKNVTRPKRSGSLTSAETSNYTTEVLSRKCSKTLKKSLEKKPPHPQLDIGFLRRMICTSWTVKKPNKTVFQKADTTRSLIKRKDKCQAIFIGHVMRREKLEHLVATGMIKGYDERKL